MADDVIPANDAEFHQLQDQFISKVATDAAKYGPLIQDVTILQTAQVSWNDAYKEHIKSQEDALTATQTKEGARGKLEAALRGAFKKVHGSVGIDDATRVSVGLRARETARTSINAPSTRPIGRIEVKANHTLVIHFVDEETPTRLAKPRGVHGSQIWCYVGDEPPADATAYSFLALDTRTPYTHLHEAALAGKTAFYILRWQNAKGEPGPWSDVVRAKIPL